MSVLNVLCGDGWQAGNRGRFESNIRETFWK